MSAACAPPKPDTVESAHHRPVGVRKSCVRVDFPGAMVFHVFDESQRQREHDSESASMTCAKEPAYGVWRYELKEDGFPTRKSFAPDKRYGNNVTVSATFGYLGIWRLLEFKL